MITHSQRRIELSRLAIAGAFLLAGLAGTAQVTNASPDAVDHGGGGAGGGAVSSDRPIFLEHFGLVPTNDGPGSFAMNPSSDAPVLVGSGPERETVANASDAPVLVGSGPERETVANAVAEGTLDETARSNDLIALTPGDVIDTAAARRGLPY